MTNKKHFPKNISQWEFDFGLFTNLPIIIVARDFSPSFSLFLWLFLTKYVSNLKTTCHVKLKIFSWTKLLENLLYAKYLISVTAPLNYKLIYVTRTHDFVFCKLFPNFFSIYGHCNQQNFSLTFKSYSKTCFISIYGIAIWKILV